MTRTPTDLSTDAGLEGIVELAETLKRVVHLARCYAKGTGTLFEDAMRDAERLAERMLLDARTALGTVGGE
jgi:hypothetical protein